MFSRLPLFTINYVIFFPIYFLWNKPIREFFRITEKLFEKLFSDVSI